MNAITTAPAQAEAILVAALEQLHGQGEQLMKAGRLEDAAATFSTCLRLRPGLLPARRSLAYCYLKQDRLGEALEQLTSLLDDHPGDLMSRLLMGRLSLRLAAPEEAIRHLRIILDTQPGSQSALSGMVDAALAQSDLDSAAMTACDMLRLKPDSTLGLLAKVRVLEAQGDQEAACRLLEAKCAVRHADPILRYHLGRALLKLGHLARGFRELDFMYAAGIKPWPAVNTPRWSGQPMARLLVIGDQGLGDTIQFSRYIQTIRNRVQDITLACDPSLAGWLGLVLGIRTVDLAAMGAVAHDAHIPIMALPTVIGDVDDVFQTQALEAFRAEASRRPPLPAGKTRGHRIGISLECSRVHSTEQFPHTRRSCTPDQALALAGLANVQFFHLQKSPAHQAQALFQGRWHELASELHDFNPSKDWVRTMDCVVTVDSVLAHLAGSLGIPTLLALPSCADWRWQFHGDRTPWYPSVVLFRQSQPGQWSDVFEKISRWVAVHLGQASQLTPEVMCV